jgi:hypothetical protein
VRRRDIVVGPAQQHARGARHRRGGGGAVIHLPPAAGRGRRVFRAAPRTLRWLAAAAVVGVSLGGCAWLYPPDTARSGFGQTEALRRVQYYYYVYELVPCIRALKFPVGPVPDVEEFLSQPPELAWSPWIALRSGASTDEIATIRSICPPDPRPDRRRTVTNL